MSYKEILTTIAITMTLFAYVPFVRSILRGTIRPHVFSWVIWGATTSIVFFAQLKDGGGIGAWPIGLSGVTTIGIAILAYLNKSDMTITRLDWIFLFSAFASLPVWFFTSDPLWAVIVLTTVDLLGFGPTIRKGYALPFEEDVVFFSIFVVRNILAMIALEHYSVTTLLFPVAISVSVALFVGMVLWRRRVLAAEG